MMQSTSGVAAEMPRYKCHKQVWALKIDAINLEDDVAQREGRVSNGGAWIYPEDKNYAPFTVDAEYVRKHKPKSGGYYVVFDDGYKSYSLAKAFEDGYSSLAGQAKSLSSEIDQMKQKSIPAPLFKVIRPGHKYELANFDDPEKPGQIIQFIEKMPGATPELPMTLCKDGTTNEAVLEMMLDRIASQNAKFPSRENSIAITHVESALLFLQRRTANRA